MKVSNRILLGLLAGMVVGAVAKAPGAEGLERLLIVLAPFGTLFIRLITMVVLPLVVASLITGIASLGDIRRLGRIGGKTLVYFVTSTIIAATIGLGVALIMHVGQQPLPPEARSALADLPPQQAAAPTADTSESSTVVQTIVSMVPQNVVASAAQGDLLPLLVAVCIFGAATTVIHGEGRRAVVEFFQGVNDLSMVVIGWLMHVAPPAVFLLIAGAVARSGVVLLRSLLEYSLALVLAFAIHVTGVLMVTLRVGARVPVGPFFRAVSDALLLAFSTASSNATLPVSMAAAEKRLGISNGIVSFVLPSGATLNKNGSAIYKAVTAVFIARLYGVDLGVGQLITIVGASTAASFAGTGVPASSLVTTLIVLNAIGLGPVAAAGIALVAGIDRPVDMCRTTVNTIGNLVGAALIARTEGETLSV